jgi:hypothetical protein
MHGHLAQIKSLMYVPIPNVKAPIGTNPGKLNNLTEPVTNPAFIFLAGCG